VAWAAQPWRSQGAAHGLHSPRVEVRRQVAHKQRGPPLIIRVIPEEGVKQHSSDTTAEMAARMVTSNLATCIHGKGTMVVWNPEATCGKESGCVVTVHRWVTVEQRYSGASR
jgi:hypothetical protein